MREARAAQARRAVDQRRRPSAPPLAVAQLPALLTYIPSTSLIVLFSTTIASFSFIFIRTRIPPIAQLAASHNIRHSRFQPHATTTRSLCGSPYHT